MLIIIKINKQSPRIRKDMAVFWTTLLAQPYWLIYVRVHFNVERQVALAEPQSRWLVLPGSLLFLPSHCQIFIDEQICSQLWFRWHNSQQRECVTNNQIRRQFRQLLGRNRKLKNSNPSNIDSYAIVRLQFLLRLILTDYKKWDLSSMESVEKSFNQTTFTLLH